MTSEMWEHKSQSRILIITQIERHRLGEGVCESTKENSVKFYPTPLQTAGHPLRKRAQQPFCFLNMFQFLLVLCY